MIKTKKGIFETNSSSSHSISISSSGECSDTLHPSDDGIIYLPGGEFGWELESYRDPITKANYCATYVTQTENLELAAMLIKVIKDFTGHDVVITASNEYADTWSYIDHQSTYIAEEAFVDEDSLRNFIFNPRSWFATDNDNH